MITPADIDNKQFSTTRLKEGYVQDEVDDFLDRVGEDYKLLASLNKQLENEIVVLRRVKTDAATTQIPVVAQTPSAVAERMLAAAETAAREHEAEAKAKADDIVREAGAQSAKIIEDAQAAAEKIKAEGLAERYRRADELDKKAERLTADIDALNDRGIRVKAALTAALSSMEEVA